MRSHIFLVFCLYITSTFCLINFPESQKYHNIVKKVNNKAVVCSDYDFTVSEPGGGVINVFRNGSHTNEDSSGCKTIREEVCEEVDYNDCHSNDIDGEDQQECSEIVKRVCTPVVKQICSLNSTSQQTDENKNETNTKESHGYGAPDIPYGYDASYGYESYGSYDSYWDDDQISFNYLFHPWVQWYRAPNVVLKDKEDTEPSHKNLAPGIGDEQELEQEKPNHKNYAPGYIGTEQERPFNPQHLLDFENLFDQVSDLKYSSLSSVPGCYPVVMPLTATLSSFFVNLVKHDDDKLTDLLQHENATQHIQSAVELFEPNIALYLDMFNMFKDFTDNIKRANLAMNDGGHVYSKVMGARGVGNMGSYLGVSFDKDISIVKCDIQHSTTKSWNEHKEYLKNKSVEYEGEDFKYENYTMDDFFFSYKGGDFNITDKATDSNISAVVYSQIENISPVVTTVLEYKNDISNKFRSGLSDVIKTGVELGINPKSPSPETLNMLEQQKFMARGNRQYLKKEHKIDENKNADEYDQCQTVSSTNIQKCWELLLKYGFDMMEPEEMVESVGSLGIYFEYYFMGFFIQIPFMLTLGAAILAGARDTVATYLPCMYDIINSEKINFDTEGIMETDISVFQAISPSVDREVFVSLPIRFIDNVQVVINDPKFAEAFDNITKIILKKLSSVVDEGEMKENLIAEVKYYKKWLLEMDVYTVMDELSSLIKMSLKYRWSLWSGNWPELIELAESFVNMVEGDSIWERVRKIMGSVVKDRWNILRFIFEDYCIPMFVHTFNFIEWLAEDVDKNMQVIGNQIIAYDGEEYMWTYYGRLNREIAQFTVCRDGTNIDIFYHDRIVNFLIYLEPSFKLFESENICKIFNVCEPKKYEEDIEAKDLIKWIRKSKIYTAVHDIYTQVLKVKQALVCRPRKNIQKTYWEYVLS